MNDKTATAFRSYGIPAIVTAIAGIMLWPFFRFSAEEIARCGLFIDDAYFYSVVARNFHNYGFLTFDGTMQTNGVQPLWMVLQIIAGYILPNIDGVVILARLSTAIYLIFAFMLTYYINRRAKGIISISTIVVSLFVILNPEFHRWVIKGLETPLILLTSIALVIVFERFFKKLSGSEKQNLVAHSMLLGALSAMVFFSRTDMFWAAVVIFGWLLYKERRISRNVIAFSATIAVLVLPYLLFNLHIADGLMPISGRVKMFYLQSHTEGICTYLKSDQWTGMFHIFDRITAFIYLPTGMYSRYLLIFLMIAGAFYCIWRLRNQVFIPAGIRMLTLTVFTHILFMHFFYRELRPYSGYYFIVEVVLFVFVLGALAEYLLNKAKERRKFHYIYSSIAFLVLLWALVVFSGRLVKLSFKHDEFWVERLKMSEDIGRIVPPGEKVGAFWPGMLAHFSGREIVPLDGIIGSSDYFENYVKQGAEFEYLCDNDISYLVIYLNANLHDDLPADFEMKWMHRGELLLRNNPDIILRELSSRKLDGSSKGWFLFETAFHKEEEQIELF